MSDVSERLMSSASDLRAQVGTLEFAGVELGLDEVVERLGLGDQPDGSIRNRVARALRERGWTRIHRHVNGHLRIMWISPR